MNPESKTIYKKENSGENMTKIDLKKVNRSYSNPDISMNEDANTTSNNLIADYNEFENDLSKQLADSKHKISRNAKVLMKTKEAPSGVDLSYKIDPRFNLPEGKSLDDEEELKIRDYDSEESSTQTGNKNIGSTSKTSSKNQKSSGKIVPGNDQMVINQDSTHDVINL